MIINVVNSLGHLIMNDKDIFKVNNQKPESQSNQVTNSTQTAYEVTQYSKKIITEAVERNGLLDRIIPDKRRKAKVKGELELMQTELAAAKRFLEITRETQKQSFIEHCNTYLNKSKAESRANSTSYLIQKQEELQDEMDQTIESFLVKMDKKLDQLENQQNPKIQEIRKQQLERDLNNFMDLQQQLMERFTQIVSEQINSQGKILSNDN